MAIVSDVFEMNHPRVSESLLLRLGSPHAPDWKGYELT